MVSLRNLTGNSYLINYWQDSFSVNLLDALRNLFRDSAGFKVFLSELLIMAIIGIIALFKKNWKISGFIVLVFVFSFLASRLREYPFAGRMMLFSVPLLVIMLAAAVDWIWYIQLRPRYIFILSATILAGLMLYAPLTVSINRFVSPTYIENIRPVMTSMKTKYEPGDMVYVFAFALPAYRYYAPLYGLPLDNIVTGENHNPKKIISEISPLMGHNRVWLIFSHVNKNSLSKKGGILSYLDNNGSRKLRDIDQGTGSNTGVYLYLYDLK